MQDGVIHVMFNHQGGPRGGREVAVPNWWMGMASRDSGRHRLTFSGMLSFEAATNGRDGYRQLFQAGEVLDGAPLVDRQHPHDFIGQAAAIWRVSLTERAALTVAGALAGEPTLGPVAFIHRASAAGLAMAPLGHHTFDSTHISFGVVAAGVEAGRWTIEGSLFNGREPDDRRWNIDPGPLDSIAARVWFHPSAEWALQVSTARLRDPEELEPGDVHRTTASASWTRFDAEGAGFAAVTAGWGVNAAHETRRHSAFVEATREFRATGVFGRLEVQQLELHSWIDAGVLGEDAHGRAATVASLTAGASRLVFRSRGWDLSAGAQVVVTAAPGPLHATHGRYPLSGQVFLTLRLPTGSMGRMWNHQMMRTHSHRE